MIYPLENNPDDQVTEGMEGEFSCQARNLAGLGTKCDVKVALCEIWVKVGTWIKSDKRTGGSSGCRNRLLILAFWRRPRPSPLRCHRCVNHTMQVNGDYHYLWLSARLKSKDYKKRRFNFGFKKALSDAIWKHFIKRPFKCASTQTLWNIKISCFAVLCSQVINCQDYRLLMVQIQMISFSSAEKWMEGSMTSQWSTRSSRTR